MLDLKITELADRFIQIQFRERTEQLHGELRNAADQMALANMATSGPHVQAAHALCARDIEIRALIVWQNLYRVLSQFGVVPSEKLASELKQAVMQYADAIYMEPFDRYQSVVRIVRVGVAQPLTEARDRALAKVNAEIDLFVLGLQRRDEAKESQSNAVFNFYSPVGAVQTAPSAVANVVQNFSSQDREALLRALDLVEQSLGAVERLPASPKEEILELVTEARTEVDKPKPNGTRLQSILTAVGTAIQTVGSLQPAYQALKAALLMISIQIP